MATNVSIQQKKDYAKLLFIKENLSQKEIAQKVGISEKTMSKWANDDNWDRLRKSLLVTKEEQIRWLYIMLDSIKTKTELSNNIIDSKTADTLIKITAAIKNLETNDITISEIFSVGKRAIAWAQTNQAQDVAVIVELFDGFIKDTVNHS
jgi:transcriptional regulator with XRE-family HTH domain